MNKRYRANAQQVDQAKRYGVDEAFGLVGNFAGPKFDETVDVAIRLGVDPKQTDQMVRGATVLPNGLGKKVSVIVFAKGEKAAEAQKAGADIVGAEDLIEKVQQGWLDFDKAIATPYMMGAVSKVGKILGPRGLMPNPKLGTVTFEVTRAVAEAKAGKVEFKIDKSGIVHVPIGKKSFGPEKLKENFLALYEAVWKAKPASAKGSYVRSVAVSATMSPSVRLDVASLPV
ncbi:MAG: 50S ribosomal protein L1 [Deltaproteobacteria bacterium]|nr:50S ribosomal protein L1 [Deltaproteobacteria bacterium]